MRKILDNPDQAIAKIFIARKDDKAFWSVCSKYKEGVREFLIDLIEETSTDISPYPPKRAKYSKAEISAGRLETYEKKRNKNDEGTSTEENPEFDDTEKQVCQSENNGLNSGS